MSKKIQTNRKVDIGIIVLIFSIIGVVLGFVIWLPHSHIPSNKASNSNIKRIADRDESSIDGSINSNNIWNNYYGKTTSEVVRFAPQFVSVTENMYLLDSGVFADYPSLPTNLAGVFENGKLEMLSLFYQISDGSLCAVKCFDSASCFDQKAMDDISDLSAFYTIQLGISSSDAKELDYDNSGHSDDFTYMKYAFKSGINCVISTCPGKTVSLMCGKKSGDVLYQQIKLLKSSMDF